MADRTERETLNHLIELCRDSERGFILAADEALTPDLRQKFLDLAEQRRRFAVDLLPHAHRLGGPTGTDGTAAAALHRAWMQFKARLARTATTRSSWRPGAASDSHWRGATAND